jgi:hypothetical protein
MTRQGTLRGRAGAFWLRPGVKHAADMAFGIAFFGVLARGAWAFFYVP